MRVEFKIDELLQDERFIKIHKKNYDELIKARRNRKEPRPGYKYKRDWFDRMFDEGNLNHKFIYDNTMDVVLKDSSVSRTSRIVIEHLFSLSIHEYFESVEVEEKPNN